MRNILFLFFACFPLMMCSQQTESLKEKFEDYFLIGATINQEDYQLIDKDEKILEIVSEDFSSVTPENSMKWMKFSKPTFCVSVQPCSVCYRIYTLQDFAQIAMSRFWKNQC